MLMLILLSQIFPCYGQEPRSVPSKSALVWYGETSNAFKALKTLDKGMETTNTLKSGDLIVRQSPNEKSLLEVYNMNSKQWMALRNSFYLTGERQTAAGGLEDKLQTLIEEAFFRAQCKPAQVWVDLTKSTPGATFYLRNVSLGEVDKNGVLHAVPGNYCRGELLPYSLIKGLCGFDESFKVVDNPTKFTKQIQLKCQ